MAPPTALFPVEERELYIVKEAIPGTIPSSVGVPVPFTSLKPSDKPVWLKDESMQGAMGGTYGIYQGPLIASIDVGGNFFGDILGHALYNLLGDYTATGSSPTSPTTLSAQCAAGATTATVASVTGYSNGSNVQLGVTSDGIPEIVTLSQAPSGSTLTFANTPARFTHASGATVQAVSAPFTHVFALLNGLVGAVNGPAQPPTHTLTDRTGVPATGLARQYAYTCMSEIVFTASAEKLLAWTGKAACYTGQIPASAIGTTLTSAVQPYPSWRTVFGVGGPASGGTQRKEIGEFQVTLTRAVKPYNTLQGAQYPYAIGRGKQEASGKITVSPAIDESYLMALLANTQPQLQLVASNGLSGANLVSLQVDIGLAAYVTADINDGSELFGYDVPFDCVHTAATFGGITMTGASGGKGAVKVTLINAIPSY